MAFQATSSYSHVELFDQGSDEHQQNIMACHTGFSISRLHPKQYLKYTSFAASLTLDYTIDKMSSFIHYVYYRNSNAARHIRFIRHNYYVWITEDIICMKAQSLRKTSSNPKVWAVMFWIILWQIASMVIGKEILLVSPLQTINRFLELAITSAFWQSIFSSLSRISFGFILAVLTGIALGILSSQYTIARDLLSPLMLTIKTVPVASFIIVALIWFSSRHLSILISFLMVLPIIYTHVLDGIMGVDHKLLEMSFVFRFPRIRTIAYIYVLQVLPNFRTACKLAIGLCWKAGIAAEVIGIPTGSIGEKLQQAKVYLNTADLFAWTFVIILLSLLFERIVSFLLYKLQKRLQKA